MGNKTGKQSEKLKELASRFRIIQQDNTKNVSLLQEKLTGQQCLLKETPFNDKQVFNKTLSRTEDRKKALSGEQHVAALLQYFETTEDHFCSNFYKLYTLYEYPHKTLNDEIVERQQCHRKFQQKELWSILASCILGLCHLQKAGIKHQSLRSDSILLTESGIIKVADPQTTNELTNYETIVNKRNTPHIYLSPQLCQALADEKVQPDNVDPNKSDVFTMGMIMMEAGLLSQQDECYRGECSKVHWDTINYNLEKFGQIYSGELRSMLELMLEQSETERPVWTELEKYVKTGDDSDIGDTRVQTPLNQINRPVIDDNVVQQSAPVIQTQVSRPQSKTNTVVRPDSTVGNNNSGSMNSTVPLVRHLGGSNTVVQPFANQPLNVTYGPINTSTSNYIPTSTSKPNVDTLQNASNYMSGPQPFQTTTTIGATSRPVSLQQQPAAPMNTSSTSKDSIIPVTQSQLESAKPHFKALLPANAYNTLTKVDQNLVEVDEQDLTKTREPDESSKSPPNSVREVQVPPIPQSNLPVPAIDPNPVTSAVSHITSYIHPHSNYIPSNPTYPVLQQPTPAQQYKNWQPTSVLPNIGSGYTTGLPSSIAGMAPYRSSVPMVSQAPLYSSIPYQPSYIPTSSFSSSMASNLPSFTSPYNATTNYAPSTIGRPQSNHYDYQGGVNGASLGGIGNIGNIGGIGSTTIGSTLPINSYNPLSTTSYLPNPKPFDPSAYKYTSNLPLSNPPPPAPTQLASAKFAESFDINANTNRILDSERAETQFVTERFKQGSRYEGQKVNGMRHGKGKFFYQDGGLYDGEWKENKMSGHGKLFYQSGRIAYDGEWKDDQFTGYGVLYNEFPVSLEKTFDYENLDLIDEYWTKFQGQFSDDLKQGKGKLFLSNGEYFEGEFDKDAATGQGKFHTTSGETVRAIWNQNQLERRLS